ncbi:hypothetical protein [Macrococcoides caseolyticum]|uniref:hypothetical protein n=1 Tax=Macrococcoides caseolyticum TaxID=69966 RepID=UPI002A23D3E9|nr:hypothetical protein [Macrococcus caseolyticus]
MLLQEFIDENKSIETLFNNLAPDYHTFAVQVKERQSLYNAIDLIFRYKIAEQEVKNQTEEEKEKNGYNSFKSYVNSIDDRNVRLLIQNTYLDINEKYYLLTSDNHHILHLINEAAEEKGIIEREKEIISKSSIINLVLNFEFLLSSCLRKYLKHKDSNINFDNKKLSLKDLEHSSDTYDQIKELAIDKTIEDILRKDFKEILIYLEKQIFQPHLNKRKLPLSNFEYINEVYETFQIRHLYIHNGGIFNSTYKSKTNSDVEIGTFVEEYVTTEYFNQRLKAFTQLGINLFLNFIDVFNKCDYKDGYEEKIEHRLKEVNTVVVKLLRDKRFDEATQITDFLLKNKRKDLIFHVNNSIANILSSNTIDNKSYDDSTMFLESIYESFSNKYKDISLEECTDIFEQLEYLGCKIILNKPNCLADTKDFLTFAKSKNYVWLMEIIYWPLFLVLAKNEPKFIEFREELIYSLIKGDD